MDAKAPLVADGMEEGAEKVVAVETAAAEAGPIYSTWSCDVFGSRAY